MKNLAALFGIIAVVVVGYLALTTVAPTTTVPVAVAAGPTYSATVYVAGHGGHFAKAEVTIDPEHKPAQSVLVLGSGISGLLHIALAKALGAGLIVATDVSTARLEAALRFGAEYAFSAAHDIPALFREQNNGLGADMIIVCAGATGAIEQALKTVERGGTILLFAPTMEGVTIPLSVNELFWRRDVTLTTAYGGSPADCVHALELILARRIPVADMITHHFGLADIAKGFRLVEQADTSIKIIIRPQE